VVFTALPYSTRVTVTCDALMGTASTSTDSFKGVVAAARSDWIEKMTLDPFMLWLVERTSAICWKGNWGRSAQYATWSYAAWS
jgi:hypothetical protein